MLPRKYFSDLQTKNKITINPNGGRGRPPNMYRVYHV